MVNEHRLAPQTIFVSLENDDDRGVTIYRYTDVSQYVWPWFDNWYGNAENRFFRYGFKIQIHLK
jgi:hypothetical protein